MKSINKVARFFFIVVCVFGLYSTSHAQYSEQIDSLNELSISYRDINSDTALLLGKKSLALSRQYNLKEQEFISLANLCFTCYENQSFNEAIQYCNEAILFEGVDENRKTEPYIWHGMSNVHLGFYNEAISSFLTYVETASVQGNNLLLADGLGNLGLAYLNDGNTTKSAEYYRAAFKVHNEIEYPIGLAYAYQNYARVMMAMSKFDSAQYYFDNALSLADRIGNDNVKYWVYAYMEFMPQYSIEHRIDIKRKALAIAIEQNLGHEIGAMNFGLAELLIETEQMDEAVFHCEEALNYGEKMENYGLVLRAYNLLANAMANLGRIEESRLYLGRYQVLKDRLSEEDINAFEAIMGANELVTQERDIEQIKDKLAASQAVNRQNQILLIAVIIFSLLIGIILFLTIKAYKVKAKTNEDLKYLNERLDASMKEKDLLTGMIIHDIRSPFNKIEALMQLLQMDREANQKEIMNTMTGVIKDSRVLTNDLMEMSKIDAGKLEKSYEPIKVETFLNDLLLQFENAAEKKKIKFLKKFDLKIESIVSSKNILQRIIENLVSNAIKYAPIEGNVQVNAKLDERKLTFVVKDNGPGIPENEQNLLFKKFGRGSARPTANEPSTGLGLFIVDKMCQNLKGEISLFSSAGKGAEFRVDIPVSFI